MSQFLPDKIGKGTLTLLISLLALGAGEYFCLPNLVMFGIILTIIASIAQVATLIANVIWYWKKYPCNKKYKDNEQNVNDQNNKTVTIKAEIVNK